MEGLFQSCRKKRSQRYMPFFWGRLQTWLSKYHNLFLILKVTVQNSKNSNSGSPSNCFGFDLSLSHRTAAGHQRAHIRSSGESPIQQGTRDMMWNALGYDAAGLQVESTTEKKERRRCWINQCSYRALSKKKKTRPNGGQRWIVDSCMGAKTNRRFTYTETFLNNPLLLLKPLMSAFKRV